MAAAGLPFSVIRYFSISLAMCTGCRSARSLWVHAEQDSQLVPGIRPGRRKVAELVLDVKNDYGMLWIRSFVKERVFNFAHGH